MKTLLSHLSTHPENGRFHNWQITAIAGGANNKLYRATSDEADIAVKFTIRDERRRAWREYQALQALAQATAQPIAAQPLLLDETSYAQPVVVQAWLAGNVVAEPPQTDQEWMLLAQHYVNCHQTTSQNTTVEVPQALVNFNGTDSALAQIEQQITAVPTTHQPPSLQRLWQASRQTVTIAPTLQQTLCRVDPNTTNFIRRSDRWFSVDWENSGWGDPAGELSDLITHPRYLDVPLAKRGQFVQQYAALSGHETAVSRARAYYPLHLVWWVARLTRMLYEVPRGLDERLAPRPANWREHLEGLLARYEGLAETAVFQNNDLGI